MTSSSSRGLLTFRDAAPVRITNRSGSSLFLLLGDHAGNLVPERLDNLGLAAQELSRHIALDIGVSRLGQRLSAILDAPFVEQRYSRLVIDCNRQVGHGGSIAQVCDGTAIPGNIGLSLRSAQERIDAIFLPYHAAIAGLLAERNAAGRATILVSLHSFTPRLGEIDRPWEIGVLHSEGNTRFAQAVLASLQSIEGLTIGDNEPYRMDETDFTVPSHAFAAKIPYVELEIRQNEIFDERGWERIARILAQAMEEAKASPDV
ncbi:N-formylglutamate amidohydrolase [Novosphingobium sp. G106]|uniref:N-formylglutamate amidohydrolase n=1 Tax=Novosphingobium sp. G106 TaxID=2849500 RepID=UPI001C2DEF15|nr:N-formylglutamate amidohydrolase [Novosphingobium sp. G106]MBV1686125.1 N-formylglutamate amidohydrolase [Novosphingobium sp. G106]MBV1691811.1 N-formylglutamate amidohydrolase [Novosphingobium sp. G106]